MSIFEGGLFDGSSLGDASDGLGIIVSVPEPISELDRWRSMYGNQIPSTETLRSKGVTHFMAEPVGVTSPGATPTGSTFSFFAGPTQPAGVPSFTVYRQSSAPVDPKLARQVPPAFAEGDGLLPASTEGSQGTPKWLPWALLGGGLLVAGGVVWSSARKPVRANRRRRSSRRKKR